jgi:hypothetical protein
MKYVYIGKFYMSKEAIISMIPKLEPRLVET